MGATAEIGVVALRVLSGLVRPDGMERLAIGWVMLEWGRYSRQAVKAKSDHHPWDAMCLWTTIFLL